MLADYSSPPLIILSPVPPQLNYLGTHPPVLAPMVTPKVVISIGPTYSYIYNCTMKYSYSPDQITVSGETIGQGWQHASLP
jgi:hypothetical protein